MNSIKQRSSAAVAVLLKKSLWLAALMLMLLGYQNCSPMVAAKFDSVQSSSAQDAPGTVPVFMASGHMQRTVYSCDDGLTWIHDQSANDDARCWVTGDPNYVECDHSEFAGHGLDFYGGAAYANFGWGYNGTVRRTTDGSHWTTLRNDGWGGGIAAIAGKLILFWGGWLSSLDEGKTWTPLSNSPAGRVDHPQLVHVGTHLIANGRNEIAVSSDQGATWTEVSSFSKDWGGSFAEGNGMLVSIGTDSLGTGQNLWAARSMDGGLTWASTKVQTGDWAYWGNVIFDGQKFVAFSQTAQYKSFDGVSWTQTPLIFSDPAFNPGYFSGPISYNPATGTYVLIVGVGSFYDQQKALRSTDGIHWTVLDSKHFKGGHPLGVIKVGALAKSACL